MAHPAEWMSKGSFGLMVHYLILPDPLIPDGNTPEEKTENFNKIARGFDAELFLRQFSKTGADWLIFALGQNTGYYISPNEFLDRELPGRTSERDIALILAERLKRAGKRFIAYLPSEVGYKWENMEEIREVFKWKYGDADQVLFQERYLEFLRAYALKFGDLLDGWFFDGCYECDYNPLIKYDWSSWIAAAKAGNPRAIVTFSNAAFPLGNKELVITKLEDYLAGEVHYLHNGKIKFGNDKDTTYTPDSRFVRGVQWHALLPLDSTFTWGAPYSYDDRTLFNWVKECKAAGGAVTLNIPISKDGRMSDKSIEQVARLHASLRA
ncbi:hypothetical protein AUJ67_03815 [Candidatus Desantisbacteria bacterium CG1_02_49_89]|nr:MAG: hypothetical protein AUJ67_03815 [Candidatus Desantisbacteria bacterium CG1_02_49_89]